MKGINDYFKSDADKEIVKSFLKANDELVIDDGKIPYIDREAEWNEMQKVIKSRKNKRD